MAISTMYCFLMKSTDGSTYTKLIDIKSFPDLGGAPELLDKTSLTDSMRTYINGIQATDALTFTANYSKADYQTLAALTGTETHYAVWFGATTTGGTITPSGTDGKFSFDGDLSVYVAGGGVNEVVNMEITIAPSTIITIS